MLFGKKKPEEDELELKDLKPQNKRKRKEPVKPWGKKDRYTVLFVLLITAILSGLLAISARDWKLPGLPRISFPKINFSALSMEETFTLENKNTPAPTQKDYQKALTDFKSATSDLSGVYGLYVIRLTDGTKYGVFENDTFQAASLIKLPVLGALYQEAEIGNINLETKYTLKNSDKIGGSGSLYSQPAGTVLTYRELAKAMGKQSDNTAFGIIRKILGDEKINDFIKKTGMTKTSLADNETSPKDIGNFFEKLWSEKIVSQKSRDEILSYLTDTLYENHLAAGTPPDIRVAHKYGREIHVINDAGIIFADKPFIVVILGKGIVESQGDKAFPNLSKLIYENEAR